MGDVRKLIEAVPRRLQNEVGYHWILSDLVLKGPMKPRPWWREQLRRLHEAGLVRPALRVHGAWEATDKARAILRAMEGWE